MSVEALLVSSLAILNLIAGLSDFVSPMLYIVKQTLNVELVSEKSYGLLFESLLDMIWSFFQVLEHQLKEVNAFIREDDRVSCNPLMKLTFGEPGLFLRSLPQNSLIHNSSIWSCRRKVSMSSLSHVVEQNNGRDALPVLWRFLQRVRCPSSGVNDTYTTCTSEQGLKQLVRTGRRWYVRLGSWLQVDCVWCEGRGHGMAPGMLKNTRFTLNLIIIIIT